VPRGRSPAKDPRKRAIVNEASMTNKKFQRELNAGTVALVLLSVIDRARGAMYGYQIAKQIESAAEDVPMMKHGALYPVLRSAAAAVLHDNGRGPQHVERMGADLGPHEGVRGQHTQRKRR
jgi:hypothetical protein